MTIHGRRRCFASSLAALCLFVLLGLSLDTAAQSAVCAEVRIEIRQKISLERQAFDAVLRIRNGLGTTSIDDVGVALLFADETGTPVAASMDPDDAGASFFVRQDGLENIEAIDGTGTVGPNQTAVARWLIIPSASSGGSQPQGRRYLIGASLTYRLGDAEPTVVEVVPETITVRPQPRLKLDYFLAGDVYADDAFTPEVEPPLPFTFGVRVSNVGAGPAHALRIESAQPQIVENDQGLLIGFSILGGRVDDQAVAPSLLLNFGDIAPGAARMGRWAMQTTLSGRFVDIDARYSHADSLGGALTSLIEGTPAAHLLVRDVLVDLPGRDGVRDFLARDENMLRVYESDGDDAQVTDLSGSASLAPAGISGQYTLSLPAHVGHMYARVADPLAGTSTTVQARRHDGTLVPAANVWLDKTRDANLHWNHAIHVFDVRQGAPYTIELDAPPADASIAGHAYLDTDGNGARAPDEPGLAGIMLSLSGASAGGSVERIAMSDEAGHWRFDALPAGQYAIVVGQADALVDGIHQTGDAGGLVQDDRITGIVLAQSQSAAGYLFAKVAPQIETAADLELIGIEAEASIATQTATVVRVRAGNIGPQATLAQAQVTLPEAFAVDASSASRGTFDAATGQWQIGAFAPGDNALLELQGRYIASGQHAFSATIASASSGAIDPVGENNQRSATITVTAQGELDLQWQLRPQTRLLVYAGCESGPACAQARAQRWSALLGAAHPHLAVSDGGSFAQALRSGEWNVVWLDGADLLPDTLRGELRETLRRGGALVLSGRRSADWAVFETLAGVGVASVLSAGNRDIALTTSEYFASDTLTVEGSATAYTVDAGRVLGQAGGHALIVASAEDAPARILVFGADPLAALEASGSNGRIAGVAHGAASVPETVLPVGARLPLSLTATLPDAPDTSVTAEVVLPSGFELLASLPPPEQSNGSQLQWTSLLQPPDHRFVAALEVQAYAAPGSHAIAASAHSTDHDAEAQIAVLLRDDAAQSAAAQQAVAVWQPADVALRAQVETHLAAALAADAQGDVVFARQSLLDALAIVDAPTTPDATAVALELSRLLQHIARHTGQPAPNLFADGFEGTP